jgi:hypothetical protein
MHCPKCGDAMDEDDATAKCVRGEMELSQFLAKGLHDSFVARSVAPKQPVPSKAFRWGGSWFCPGCGVLMSEVPDTNGVICPDCGGNLGPFIYQLIEHHPHRFGDHWG